MATVVVTVKIMPDSPEADLERIKGKVQAVIEKFTGRKKEEQKTEIEPVAFGLNALKIFFAMDENKGSPDVLEEKMKSIEGVQSFEVTDVRRAIG